MLLGGTVAGRYSTPEEWEALLHTLHTTDGFEGEPGYPIPREHFLLMEYHHAHTRP